MSPNLSTISNSSVGTRSSPNPDSCGGTGGCMGATTELGFEYIADTGVVEEYQIGYSAYQGVVSVEEQSNGMTLLRYYP